MNLCIEEAQYYLTPYEVKRFSIILGEMIEENAISETSRKMLKALYNAKMYVGDYHCFEDDILFAEANSWDDVCNHHKKQLEEERVELLKVKLIYSKVPYSKNLEKLYLQVCDAYQFGYVSSEDRKGLVLLLACCGLPISPKLFGKEIHQLFNHYHNKLITGKFQDHFMLYQEKNGIRKLKCRKISG